MDKCGLCGSEDIYSGSWAPDKCRKCGAIGAPGGWYIEKSNVIDLDQKRNEKKQGRADAIRKGIKKLADKLSWT